MSQYGKQEYWEERYTRYEANWWRNALDIIFLDQSHFFSVGAGFMLCEVDATLI